MYVCIDGYIRVCTRDDLYVALQLIMPLHYLPLLTYVQQRQGLVVRTPDEPPESVGGSCEGKGGKKG